VESPTSSASPAEAPPPPSLGRVVGKLIAWTIGLGIVAALVGDAYWFEIPVKLAFGWFWFMKENAQAMQPNWLLIGEGVACVAVLAFGGHYFMRWLWTGWRPRWTAAGLATLLLLFVAGIATIGITHQAAWLFTAKGPLLVDPFSDRFRISSAILNSAEVREAVSEHFLKTGRLPQTAAEMALKIAPIHDAKSVQLGEKGVISIELVETLSSGGGTILLTPVEVGGQLEWKCSSDLQNRFLPGSCRRVSGQEPPSLPGAGAPRR
jgi:hypothetical protein